MKWKNIRKEVKQQLKIMDFAEKFLNNAQTDLII